MRIIVTMQKRLLTSETWKIVPSKHNKNLRYGKFYTNSVWILYVVIIDAFKEKNVSYLARQQPFPRRHFYSYPYIRIF